MQKKNDYTFMTGSRFSGSYNSANHCMDGFGLYTFPDGSEYRGYFKNGKFNGYGRLKLAPPNKFIFSGLFDDGDLIQIEDMFFGDGLRFNGEIKDEQLDCSKWTYCTENDRRYPAEILNEIEAVGPNAYLTRDRPARQIPINSYDTEEGIFKPTSGWLTKIPKPFYQNRFICCKKERDWILKNCRHGQTHYDGEDVVEPPNLKYWKRILETNINLNLDAAAADYKCECQRLSERQHLRQQIKEEKTKKLTDDSASAFSNPYTLTESSCPSLDDHSMKVPVADSCLTELGKYKFFKPRPSELPKIRPSYTMRLASVSD